MVVRRRWWSVGQGVYRRGDGENIARTHGAYAVLLACRVTFIIGANQTHVGGASFAAAVEQVRRDQGAHENFRTHRKMSGDGTQNTVVCYLAPTE